VKLDQALHEGEPEAEAAAGPVESLGLLHEEIEYATEQIGANARAGVGHPPDGVGARALDGEEAWLPCRGRSWFSRSLPTTRVSCKGKDPAHASLSQRAASLSQRAASLS
jgi:hypothetical protein